MMSPSSMSGPVLPKTKEFKKHFMQETKIPLKLLKLQDSFFFFADLEKHPRFYIKLKRNQGS